jgi:GNAT superfamily N-acetyltransferase
LRTSLRTIWRLHVCGRSRVVLLAGPIGSATPDQGADGITFGPATAEDLAAMPALRAFDHDAPWLWVARHGGRVVGYRRSATRFPGGMLDAAAPARPGRVFTVEVFVRPEYRQHRVAVRLGREQNSHLAQTLGATEAVASVDASNVASLRLTLRLGYRPIAFVDAFRCLRRHRYTVSATMPPDVQHVVDAFDQSRDPAQDRGASS